MKTSLGWNIFQADFIGAIVSPKLGNFSPYDLPKGEIEREALVDCYWEAHHHGHYFQHCHLQIARESVSQIATVWIINVKLVWNSMKIPQGSEYWNGICIKKGSKGLGITEKNEKKSRFLLKREYDSHRSFSRVIFCRFQTRSSFLNYLSFLLHLWFLKWPRLPHYILADIRFDKTFV